MLLPGSSMRSQGRRLRSPRNRSPRIEGIEVRYLLSISAPSPTDPTVEVDRIEIDDAIPGDPTASSTSTPSKSAQAAAPAGYPYVKQTTDPATTISTAIDIIKQGPLASTADGQKIITTLQNAQQQGKIQFGDTQGSRGKVSQNGVITINQRFKFATYWTATSLAHEAEHIVYSAANPNASKNSIAEEMACVTPECRVFEDITKNDNAHQDSGLKSEDAALNSSDPNAFKTKIQQVYAQDNLPPN